MAHFFTPASVLLLGSIYCRTKLEAFFLFYFIPSKKFFDMWSKSLPICQISNLLQASLNFQITCGYQIWEKFSVSSSPKKKWNWTSSITFYILEILKNCWNGSTDLRTSSLLLSDLSNIFTRRAKGEQITKLTLN